MRNLFFTFSVLAILSSSAISCSKNNDAVLPSAQPDMVNKFVGNYMGDYVEVNPQNRMNLNAMQTVITKKSATDVRLSLSVSGVHVALNGTLENDTKVKITDSKYFDNDITSGTVTLKDNNNICLKLMLHDSFTGEVSEVVYNGKK